MDVEIGTKAKQFLFWECINIILVTVGNTSSESDSWNNISLRVLEAAATYLENPVGWYRRRRWFGGICTYYCVRVEEVYVVSSSERFNN